MGCGNAKESEPIKKIIKINPLKEEKDKILHIEIDKSLDKFEEDIQKIFIDYKEFINEILESIRYPLIDLRERIIYLTGACCIKDPDFKMAVSTFLIDLGRQNDKGVESFRKASDFSSKDCVNNVPENKKDALENIYYYVNILARVNNFDEIIDMFNKKKEKLDNELDNYKNKVMDNANKSHLVGMPLIKNLENIQKIFNIFDEKIKPILIKNYNEDYNFLMEFYRGKYFADPEFIENINSYAKKFKNLGDQYNLAYHGLGKEDNRCYGSSPETGKKEYQIIIDLKTKEKRWSRSEQVLQYIIDSKKR